MRRSKKREAIVEAARTMPPLFHKLPNETYDVRKSRVLWWLVKQPAVLEYLWDLVKQSGAIAYHPDTKKWEGVDFVHED